MKMTEGRILHWAFPLPEAGTGVQMGNGTLGLMVWGTERLAITVSRNGFWDRRGGALPRSGATYAELKRLLDADDTAGAARLFTRERKPGDRLKSTQLPCARLEIVAEGWKPERIDLDLGAGVANIRMVSREQSHATIRIGMARGIELAWLECDALLGDVSVEVFPMWNFLSETLSLRGCEPPLRWQEEAGGGVCQKLPDDPALALAWRWHGRKLALATSLSDDPVDSAKALAQTGDLAAEDQRSATWWDQYWRDVPRLSLPDAELQHAYLYGAFQQAGLTPAEGVAATLVGPWMEENYLPCWSNDYHFNINVQMIYWPCLSTNRTEHLWPLWKLILSWMPQLRANATQFFEVDDAVMLPHAVNDHGKTVDDFWSGMIDHGCTAWMAQLAWLHYRYAMDERILREVAWPLLVGAFNGYWAMSEEIPDGKGGVRLSLPITVSPEYGGAGEKSWGRDASFQLAAWHMISAILPQAAVLLGEAPDPRWERVSRDLPPYVTMEGGDVWNRQKKVTRLVLWEGQDLDGSHRHHSHLAALYPFDSIDPSCAQHRSVITRTIEHWISCGSGMWSGWSLPWAAALAARYDAPDACISWLRWWRNVYTNVGHGSDHNGDFVGCTVLNRGYLFPEDPKARYRPAIQLDGAMGAVTAILEILVQCRKGTVVVLPQIPRRWREFSFEGIRTEGAFLVGADVRNGELIEIRVTSLVGARLRLAHTFGDGCECDGQIHQGSVLETVTTLGQHLVLKRINLAD